ncbi:aminodeoxychorismate synthase component I [Pseudomonas sp. CFBP 8770]|uniref:aminodeoxychorismate synthase component I n=1 Tax=unclassified Pseudomonas TaxID=196821 RepID=UPI00177F31E9|nr:MULTISPECIES: aminodeoxychorismate synthase component I [unclassified Pseudomonas]MBD8473484.1 aminodeoxychorismate synthase component I [Pseudomonas sp. CFBP 8773]MBD8646611.1 aminodeoxychorismate synthase component I [Pseudomonas sp. CFBP 8770]
MPTCSLHALPYLADPAPYFAAVRHAPGAVLLDSAQPIAQRGRFDLISAWPVQTLGVQAGESGQQYLQRARVALAGLGQAQLPDGCELPFAGGLIGYLSYDFGRRLENLPAPNQDDLDLPHANLGLYAWALISNHRRQTSELMFHPALDARERQRLIDLFAQPATLEAPAFRLHTSMTPDRTPEQYRRAFEKVQAYIQAGDCYQVNLTQRFRAACSGDPWTAYQAVRAACSTPFSGYLQLAGGAALLSFSPERFLKVTAAHVETRPIKGTRPRSLDREEDARQGRELLASAKDRSENLMIVDLLRNDLGRSCRIGSVRVPQLFALESYPNVHHLVSAVTGELAADKDCLDLIACSFPGGSITGAPKIRAMQIIDEVEPTQRAIYCGSLLYLDVRGEMDSSIAIRTLLVKDGQVCCWGGGAIVADSQWQAEYQESIFKVSVLLDTLAGL